WINRSERHLDGLTVGTDESLFLQVKDDLLRRLVRCHVCGVNHYIGILWGLVWVRYAGNLLDQSGPGLGVESLPVSFFANLNGSSDMHQYKTSVRLDHFPHLVPDAGVRRDRCAECNATVLGNFRRHKANAPDVDVAVFFGKP